MKTHIQLPKSEKHSRVIVCGSPERAAWFASQLDDSREVARNREYHSFLGQRQGVDILVVSHGVGAAGAAICFQELIDAGAKSLIRIGTAGGFYTGTRIGDIVVPTAAVRKDGVSAQMIPLEFPAVPDFELTRKVHDSLRTAKTEFRSGTVLSTDLFYPGKLPISYPMYQEAGVVAVEMECSALFVVAQLRGAKSGALLVLDGNPLSGSSEDYDPRPERLAASMSRCFQAAVNSLISE